MCAKKQIVLLLLAVRLVGHCEHSDRRLCVCVCERTAHLSPARSFLPRLEGRRVPALEAYVAIDCVRTGTLAHECGTLCTFSLLANSVLCCGVA